MRWRISKSRLDYLVVFVDLDGEPIPVGALTFEGQRRNQSYFTYARSWLSRQDRFPLAPVGLPLRARAVLSAPHEVPLPFADTAPDGWGRGVLHKAFPDQQFGMGEYLAASGDNRTGWFRFGCDPATGPEQWIPDSPILALSNVTDLGALAAAADAADRGEPTHSDLIMLYRSSSDVGGARPKARLQYKGRDWIAKFQAWGDSFDEPRVEGLCLSLASACGIETPDHQVVSIGRRSVLLVERFDRSLDGHRFGYVSAGTLMGSPTPAYGTQLSYLDIAVQARQLGIKPCEDELWRRLLFNAIIRNTDDHLLNHAFIGQRTDWKLSPVFDIVPQRSANMTLRPVPGMSAAPDPVAILSTWPEFGIAQNRAEQIVADMAKGFESMEALLERYEIVASDRKLLKELIPYAFALPVEMASKLSST